ncbi:MAG: guanylate cyclase, partial [Proteobacteria bacterium]|nr:guanylate cyclase [Pseudomonadota bacterium]
LEQAQKFVEKAVNLARQRNEKSVEGVSKIWMGRILGKKDKSKVDKAEGCILQGIKILEELKQKPSYAEGYVYLGELYGDTGHREKALENLKKAEGMFKEMGMDYWLARTQEVLEGL